LISLIVGGLVGWLASIVMKTNAQQGVILNVVVGLIGSGLGSYVFGDLLQVGSARASGTVLSLCWSVIGACLFIGILKVVHVLR
jgi:uncharacterized membrane protein YeaQ/YmgE (transglycosylase-associated protein family)